MKIINAEQVEQHVNFDILIEELKQGFSRSFTMPQRQSYSLDFKSNNSRDGLALLPAWNDEVIATKVFTYFPDNEKNHQLPSLFSKILLFSRHSGEPLALLDGTSITYWRTAAVSALASSLLSRENSRHLLLCGTGQLASYLLHAHLSVRELRRVTLWGRNTAKVQTLLKQFTALYPEVDFHASVKLEHEIPTADIICCATGAKTPLFNGKWLTTGTHVDCLGNHLKDARECDSTTVSRARVYVDSLSNCLAEAGELLIPITEGSFKATEIIGELADICIRQETLRQTEEEITLFKSVGTALSDLLCANLVYQKVKKDAGKHK
ncbi:ornithine cyclodeaminase family protein [Thalassomonas actiniarum]|uniref:Ornithine cyclodeaminase family protein n=1 Tax=Thalassomonas actiniarum TaxID=485447 RepID=A0AAF0C1U7_9GAMM|nr:ornithine cyclodeaminase family protein [Thalassomonas actiniarum]WDD97313.1 ornithine cyclodeaminase family protein [Thalassomonas actiniarum]